MDNISYNSYYLIKNGRPWLPIMGELPFSRTNCEQWDASLCKMKAGGVEIVQSYIVWIHHEEIENEWDFSGNRNLRNFLKAIKKNGLYAMLRVGPFIHGEVRNGGFPDWLIEKGWPLRCNDENYLNKVREYFGKLYEQAKGYFLSDGGPIIGIQVENEYGHCISENSGPHGNGHMLTLEKMLKEMGFDAPIYTATGWGGAHIADMLPVWGGYCDHPWMPGSDPLPPNHNFIFTNARNDHQIGADFGTDKGLSECDEGHPYFTSELGGGIHCTENRRPIVYGKDIGAMSLCKLGSGMNLFGYYLYHGGKNPVGKLSYMSEYAKVPSYSAACSNVLQLSYDFQAPIDEFGKIRDAFKEIKLFGLFLPDFGEDIAPLKTYIPENSPKQDNLEELRYAVRKDNEHGYIFFNNYQKRYPLKEHNNVDISVELDEETIKIPSFDLRNGEYFFLPFNFKVGNSLLKTTNATPLCLLNKKSYIFYTDREPVYNFEDRMDPACEIITLNRKDALSAYKVVLDKQYLFISNSVVIQKDEKVHLIGTDKPEFKVYPELTVAPEGFTKIGCDGVFTCYEKDIAVSESKVSYTKISEGEYKINIDYGPPCNDVILSLKFKGNKAKLFIDGVFSADCYYNGADWNLSMKYLDFPKEIIMKIDTLLEDTPVALEEPLVFDNGVANSLLSASVSSEHRTVIF